MDLGLFFFVKFKKVYKTLYNHKYLWHNGIILMRKELISMHPLERLCEDYRVTLYSLSQGVKNTDNTLRRAVKNNADVNNLTLKTIKTISNSLDISLDELINRLDSYQ